MDGLNLLNQIVVLVGVPAIGGWLVFLGRKLQRIDDTGKTIEVIKRNVKTIANSLTNCDHVSFDNSLLQDYSPLQLTPKGEQFIRDKGFDSLFSENKEKFFAVIDADHPTSKFDVESSSYKSIVALLHKEFFNPIKKYYYEHPKESVQNFAKVAGVYVRDRYLEEHKNITE